MENRQIEQARSRIIQLPTFSGVGIGEQWLIVLLGVTCVVFTLVSMWNENRFGWPLRGIIWFYLVIVGSCAVIALLARILAESQGDGEGHK